MFHRSYSLLALFAIFSFTLLSAGVINYAYADQNTTERAQQQAAKKIYGKVTNVLEAAGYTYAEVDTGSEKVWAAASTTPVKVGDMIAFTTEMPMKNFHSNALKRDFPTIYFVSRFITDSAGPAAVSTEKATPHANIKSSSDAKAIEGIAKVEGGNTIAEVYTDKQKLNGNAVRVRGQVTKFTANVMGKNWLHIRDSSTSDDLTVISENDAAINDVVIIDGKLALDKDFGYGYVYPLIVEDASVAKDK